MTRPTDGWLSEADLDALVDAGHIDPEAEAPVAKLAKNVVVQLERTLGGLGTALADAAWGTDVNALEDVRIRIDRLAYAADTTALPALDRLLRILERAGQPDFASALHMWCSEVDRTLEGR